MQCLVLDRCPHPCQILLLVLSGALIHIFKINTVGEARKGELNFAQRLLCPGGYSDLPYYPH